MAADGFVDVFFAEFDQLVAFGKTVGVMGDVAAADADGVDLGHVFGGGHQRGHGAEGFAEVVHVEAGDDDADAPFGELACHVDDGFVEELGFVDAYHVDAFRLFQDASGGIDRGGEDGMAFVRDDGFLGVAGVDLGFEDFDAEIGDLGPLEPADEFFGLAGKHRAADDFDPTGILCVFYEHFYVILSY